MAGAGLVGRLDLAQVKVQGAEWKDLRGIGGHKGRGGGVEVGAGGGGSIWVTDLRISAISRGRGRGYSCL